MANKKKNKNEPVPVKGKQGKASIEKQKAEKRNLWIAAAVIAVLTLLVYLPVFSNGFVNLDDDRYITKQPLIHSIDFKSFFTTNGFVMGNYHPIVITLYSILYHFCQLNPVPYHVFNLIIHIINSILVLWLLYYITGSFRIAVIVGLLFGIHPLHVESVAWASELKDLMYTFGFLSSLIFYVRYIKQNQPAKLYVYSLLLFLFSLFSKGMGVSLTAVLFLIDYYLGRKFTTKTILEKLPFFVLSVVFGVVAIYAQKSLGAIQDLALFSFPQRIVFACYGFITYIVRVFAPVNLCAYYPYPVKTGDTIPGIFYGYPVILAALLVGVFYSLKATKKVFFGVGFFAITVFLVLQLLPVGGAITADRYSYIPSIGIFFLIAEGIIYLTDRNKTPSNSFTPVSAGVLGIITLFFCFLTYNQVKIWKDGMTMWSNVIKNYQTVSLAYNNRGVLYKDAGELDNAMSDYSMSLVLNPKNADSWSNKGLIFWQKGLANKEILHAYTDSALVYLDKSIEIDPKFATAYGNKGSVLSTRGDQQGAIACFSKSIELDPNFAESYYNRGIVNYNLGHKDVACPDFKRAGELGYSHSADAFRDLCK